MYQVRGQTRSSVLVTAKLLIVLVSYLAIYLTTDNNSSVTHTIAQLTHMMHAAVLWSDR